MEDIMTIHLAADSPLLRSFGSLPDPRKTRNQIYPITDILSIAIIGILCSGNNWIDIVKWAVYNLQWFQSVGLCLNGIPSHDTLNRFFRFMDSKAFENCFLEWMQTISEKIQGVIAVDGKTIRNSGNSSNGQRPFHLISAFAAENEVVLGQLATDSKSNEITAIPKLLDMFILKDAIITIDAMGCQKAIAKKIKDKGGNYVFGLKGNQSTLQAEVSNFFNQAWEVSPQESGCSYNKTIEKDHGRIEERVIWATSDLSWLEEKEAWQGLKSLICVKSTRIVKEKETTEMRYYISSLEANAKCFGKIIRLHWGIENKLHWHLDVTFNEDKSKIYAGNGAENFSILKRCVLNVVKGDTTEKGSISLKRKIAGWSPAYRLRLLGVK
jgi:predicted transposase YbfD/YdcC